MKVTLVISNKKPISVGVGKFCFSLENNQVANNEPQRIGSELRGPSSLSEYVEAFNLAQLAWEAQLFDDVEMDKISLASELP